MEKVQKGNPRNLSVNQHVFPRMSISRFSDHNGNVEVNLIENNKVIKCKPENKIFSVYRYWDQRAEQGYMKNIEDCFQSLVEALLIRKNQNIYKDEQFLIHQMYGLWNVRFHASYNPIKDQRLKGIEGYNASKDQEEELESIGMTIARSKNSVTPGRFITGLVLQTQLDDIMRLLSTISWRLVISKKLDFIVPECFHNRTILPISPNLALIAGGSGRVLSNSEMRAVNMCAVESSKRYWFARDIRFCL